MRWPHEPKEENSKYKSFCRWPRSPGLEAQVDTSRGRSQRGIHVPAHRQRTDVGVQPTSPPIGRPRLGTIARMAAGPLPLDAILLVGGSRRKRNRNRNRNRNRRDLTALRSVSSN